MQKYISLSFLSLDNYFSNEFIVLMYRLNFTNLYCNTNVRPKMRRGCGVHKLMKLPIPVGITDNVRL